MTDVSAPRPGDRETCAGVVTALLQDPSGLLVKRWNWKSALLSSFCRGLIFLLVNLSAGLDAAAGAMAAEFAYRAATSGFSGALTQAFRSAEPRWAAVAGIPLSSHLLEFLVHWLRGTPNLSWSIGVSLAFTLISTSFNLFAMSRGVLVVGRGSRPLIADLQALPLVTWRFVKSGLGFWPVSSTEKHGCPSSVTSRPTQPDAASY